MKNNVSSENLYPVTLNDHLPFVDITTYVNIILRYSIQGHTIN